MPREMLRRDDTPGGEPVILHPLPNIAAPPEHNGASLTATNGTSPDQTQTAAPEPVHPLVNQFARHFTMQTHGEITEATITDQMNGYLKNNLPPGTSEAEQAVIAQQMRARIGEVLETNHITLPTGHEAENGVTQTAGHTRETMAAGPLTHDASAQEQEAAAAHEEDTQQAATDENKPKADHYVSAAQVLAARRAQHAGEVLTPDQQQHVHDWQQMRDGLRPESNTAEVQTQADTEEHPEGNNAHPVDTAVPAITTELPRTQPAQHTGPIVERRPAEITAAREIADTIWSADEPDVGDVPVRQHVDQYITDHPGAVTNRDQLIEKIHQNLAVAHLSQSPDQPHKKIHRTDDPPKQGFWKRLGAEMKKAFWPTITVSKPPPVEDGSIQDSIDRLTAEAKRRNIPVPDSLRKKQ